MMAPLARDQHGNPFELPPEAKLWRVRRHTRGRPADVMGPGGEPLFLAIEDDQSDLRANGCTGPIRLDAVDADRRPLSVQATYVDLGSGEEALRVTSSDGDKEMVRVCFDSMTRTMEGMQRAQVERERTLAQKEQALTDAQIASQKMMVELMLALLDRVGGAKPQDALSVLKQQFEIQKTLEKQTTRNAPALPAPIVESKDDKIPGWLKTALPIALPGLQELAVVAIAKGDEGKAQAVRNMCGGILNAVIGGAGVLNPQTPAPPAPTSNEEEEEREADVEPEATVLPPQLSGVLAQLTAEEQMVGFQLLSWLDHATTEKVIAGLSGMPSDQALARLRSMIDEARKRGASVAHRAVASAFGGAS